MVRRNTALQWLAAMACGETLNDLFHRFELLLLNSEAKKLGLPCLLVSYKPLVIIFFGQQNRHLRLFAAVDTRVRRKSCPKDVLLKS